MLHVLLFLFLYFFGFVLTFLANPVASFVLYEIVYFFNPLQRWWAMYIPTLSYSLFTVLLMFLALILNKKAGQRWTTILTVPQFRWIYFLLFLYWIAGFYAVIPEGHNDAFTNYFKLIVIISVAFLLIDNVKKLDYALWGYVFGSWYLSFLIYQTGRNAYGRVEGVGTVDSPDANGIAAAIAPSIVVALYYFWVQRSKAAKFLFAFAGVFVANAIILINSRGSFLGVALSLFFFMYYLYFGSVRRQYQLTVAVIITVFGAAGALHLADETFFSRVSTMQNTEITLEQQTATTRIIFWKSAWALAKDKPFGSGFQGFDYYAPEYLPEDMDTGFTRNRSVHSTWFEALTEIGYIGFAGLIILVYASFRTLRRCMHTLKNSGDTTNYYKVIMLQAALLAFVVCMSFMNRFRAEILYWMILYSACAYNLFEVSRSKPSSDRSTTDLI